MTPGEREAAGRPAYAAAGLASAVILVLYIITIAPTTQFWDTSEYIAAAKVLGVPHPPGNPLFVLLANVWGMIPLVEHYALRINLFAAVTSALASGFLFLVADRFLRDVIPAEAVTRHVVAFAGVFVGATAFTVWNQSVVNEKVYTLSLLCIALTLWLATRWADAHPGSRRDQLLLLILYLLALGSTNHSMGLLSAPAIVVLGFMTLTDEGAPSEEWGKLTAFAVMSVMLVFLPSFLGAGNAALLLSGVVLLAPLAFLASKNNSQLAAAALIAVIVGLSLNVLFLRIRAGLYPPINEGEPTTWDGLQRVLTRFQYQKPPLSQRQADLGSQYANYLQYFSWQFGRDWTPTLRNAAAALFGILGLLGAAWHWIRDRRHAAFATTAMLTVTVLLVFYLNFKYGYSIRPGENLEREVRERDYFFIASFQFWGVWIALGFAAIVVKLSQLVGNSLQGIKLWIVTAPVLALGLVPLAGNWLSASRADETLARDVAWDMLQSVEPYGILITAGDNDTFPLWYMQEVEGVRQDVTVANLSLMNTGWHNRQLKRRTAAPFDSTNAIPLWQGRSWPRPTNETIAVSFEELDALPPYFQVPEDQVFQSGQIQATLPDVLERADIITLRLIQDNLGKRPIYIGRTTGNYGDRMGLTPYLLGQGLVGRLMPQALQPSDSTVYIQTLGWMDIETTRRLLFEVYHPETPARERPFGWVDTPSESIITLYAVVYAAFSEALAAIAADTTGGRADSSAANLVAEASELAQRMLDNTSYSFTQRSR
jgi:hypothetical protein